MRAAVIGLAVAGVATFLVWRYTERFQEEASGGPRVQVLTVVKTLEPGATLTEADIGERGIPMAYVESRAIRASDRNRIVNLRISSALEAQQILNWSDIVATNDERMLSNLVQTGMRAVSVHTEGRSSSLAHPGDRVDVISTVPQPGTQDHRVGVVLLQNVLVLGKPAGQGSGMINNSEGADTVLSLTLEQSQLLAVAGDKARLTLALRSTPDMIIQQGLAEKSTKDLAEPPKVTPRGGGPTGPLPMQSGKK